jgi:glucan phosphoethanolaminetransferase (alkaline phosphatase superfamily)
MTKIFLAILITINSSLSCKTITRKMKYVLTLLILVVASMSMCSAQSEVPGQKAFESALGTNVDLDLEKCCIAAHGWHIASEIKFEGINPTALKSNEVAEELL